MKKSALAWVDLKIFSIGIANEAILVSRNLNDFEKVPVISAGLDEITFIYIKRELTVVE